MCHLTSTYSSLLLGLVLAVLLVTGRADAGDEATVVQTQIGKIRGLVETRSWSGEKYLAFRGIRYANPPVKDLRFKEPVSISGWEGVLEATTDAHPCPQLHIATNQVIGKEDCLVLNVYTPDVDNLKPVIIFIHGGGFVTGAASSELYGPDYLMDENVVLVTIQYRLGVFGFLSTGDEQVAGNWGLWDQVEALRWVQSNIPAFGGDPSKVTLLGEGAGAASATLLTLIPKAQGLFRNVIALAGSPLNSQYFQTDPLESARELASRLKCQYSDQQELVSCFRKATAESMIKEVNQMFSFFSFPRWFAPNVDNILLSKSPEKLLKDGKLIKVPVLTGLGRHEGAFYYPLTLNSFNDGKYDGNFIDQRIPRLLPVFSEFQSKLFPITKALKTRYFTNIDIDSEDDFRPRYVELLTDLLYTRFTSRYAELAANHSVPVYSFILDYYGSNSIMNVIGDTDTKSIAHGDVLQYLFSQVLGEGKELPDDDKEFTRKTFLPLIINFVKTSNPTPSGSSFGLTWPKYTKEDQTVVSLGKTLSLLPQFRSNILKFWDEALPQLLGRRGNEKDEL